MKRKGKDGHRLPFVFQRPVRILLHTLSLKIFYLKLLLAAKSYLIPPDYVSITCPFGAVIVIPIIVIRNLIVFFVLPLSVIPR